MKFVCSLLLALGIVCLARDMPMAQGNPGTAQQDTVATRSKVRHFHIPSPEEYRAKKMQDLVRHKQDKLRKKELFRLTPFDSSYYKGLALGTNIVTLTDPVEWGPAFTAEYRFARRWSAGGSLKGILATIRDDPDKAYYDPPFESSGFRITANVKYFLPWAKRFKWFVGFEGMYKRLDYTVYIPHSMGVVGYDDLFHNGSVYMYPMMLQPARTEIHTQYTLGGGPVFGMQQMMGRHFQFEWYMGLYLVHKVISLHGMTPVTVERRPDAWRNGWIFPGNDEAFSRTAWDAKLPLGIRFSYFIGSRAK